MSQNHTASQDAIVNPNMIANVRGASEDPTTTTDRGPERTRTSLLRLWTPHTEITPRHPDTSNPDDLRTHHNRKQTYNSNRTSGHLKVVMLIRPLDTSELRTHQSRNQSHNSNRTSGHLKVVTLIRPLDTSDKRTHQSRNQSYNSNPTSGHLKVKILNRPLDTSRLKF